MVKWRPSKKHPGKPYVLISKAGKVLGHHKTRALAEKQESAIKSNK